MDRAHRLLDDAILLLDGHVVDGGMASVHEATLVEGPMLQAIGAPPSAVVVAVLVVELDRDPVSGETEQLLAQAVVVLLGPLLLQESPDGGATLQEPIPIAPDRVLRVRPGHLPHFIYLLI